MKGSLSSGFTLVEAIVSTLLVALFVLSITTFFSLQNKNAYEWKIRSSSKDLMYEAENVLKFYPLTFQSGQVYLARIPIVDDNKEMRYEFGLVPGDEGDAYREGKYLSASGDSVIADLVKEPFHWYRRTIHFTQITPVVFPYYYKVTISVFHEDCNSGKSPCAEESLLIPAPISYE